MAVVCKFGQDLDRAEPALGHREVEDEHNGQDGANGAPSSEEKQLQDTRLLLHVLSRVLTCVK